jgi:NAD(P)-dependent dehydrogenase (short-subunit alcohol dehydrogenase family)
MTGLLDGKVAIVTGGASGIGRATAQLFAQEGAHIVIADRQREPREGGEPTDELIAARGDVKVRFVAADLTVAGDRERVVATADEFGGVDILLDNAGMYRRGSIFDVTEADYDAMTDINIKAVFFMAQVAARRMVEKGRGNIIIMSSIAGLSGGGTSALYAMTKGAVRLLTHGLGDELGPLGIRVNAIHPGVIESAMTTIDSSIALGPSGEAMVANVPVRRLGRPEDIAKAALFLASDLSDYITATSLRVDGGMVRS